jgi:glucose/arabinose dehydrogenase
MRLATCLVSALALLAAMPAAAQQGQPSRNAESAPTGNLDRLQRFQSTGVRDFTMVEQQGRMADQIRSNLQRIEMPDGFSIDLYALAPDARHMAVGRNVGVVFVGTRKNDVWVVTDRDRDRTADEVKRFAPSVQFTIPNGVCFSPDGFLFVAEQNRVLAFPAAEFFYESPDVAVETVVAQGRLIPEAEESFNHSARVCDIGPDNKLYISLGQPFNVQPREKLDLYEQVGIGGIVRMDRDGQNREVYARGIRNSVGMDFRPGTSELWFTDNQVDGLGDDIPPEELNKATRAGQHFGFPYYGGEMRIPQYADAQPPADAVAPEVLLQAHAASLGAAFGAQARNFPERYRNGIFVAQHGSWNRTEPVGARIMFVPISQQGEAGEPEVFASGWLDQQTGEYLGRPVDVAFLPDGSMLVSDDLAGAIYRVSYQGGQQQRPTAQRQAPQAGAGGSGGQQAGGGGGAAQPPAAQQQQGQQGGAAR